MESICRLCSSTKLVNNYLFDEETALNLKMELFLPIKIIKGDDLPQKVCNRCSCKINDIYQFCNFAIETQDRLRSMFLQLNHNISVNLTITKQEPQMTVDTVRTEQATQTDNLNGPEEFRADVELKVERSSVSPSLIKRESSFECDDPSNIPSDDSEDLSLILLKEKKSSRKPNSNGEGPKKTRKKKTKGDLITVVEPINLEQQPLKVKREYEDKEEYQCCICFNIYYLKSVLLQHYRQHVSEVEDREAPPPPPHTERCPRCRKPIEASVWASHWARHCARDLRPYRCALCEKTFRSPALILKHGMTHKPGEVDATMQKRFICDLCPEGFYYMRFLLAHRSRAHPEAAGRAVSLRCAQCSRTFAHLNSLRRHLRAHTGEKNFLCSVCGKSLSSREHLKFHLRIHTGYKPHICKTCGKGFVKKCNLTLHERVHSGEKPHVCSHCGKAFSQRSTLVIHERYHSGARPYSCELCGRGFVAKGLLSMHLKTTCI